jgi:hypothetical protein
MEHAELQDGLDQTISTIGYRIYLVQAEISQQIHREKAMPITLTLSNDGIAPLYYNWPTTLDLFDADGNTVSTHQLPSDLRKVLPGEFYDVTDTIPLDHLKNGTYSIGIAIRDPITYQPAVKSANENPRHDLIQYIGSFEVKRFADFN